MSELAGTGGEYPASKVVASIMGMVVACWALAFGLGPATIGAGGAAQLTDLSDATLVEIRTLDGEVAMSGEFRSRVDELGNIEKDAALIGAEYRPGDR